MNDNLLYEWLEFASLQKAARKPLIKEQADLPQEAGNQTAAGQVYRASATNPAAAAAFGDYEYTLVGNNGDQVKIINNPIQMAQVQLKCGVNDKVVSTVSFHQKYVNNLSKAYYEGSKASGYCPIANGGFNARKVRSPQSRTLPVSQRHLSNHSFGTAIDFDAAKNDYVKGAVSEMEQHPKFIEAFEANGFKWLGDGAGRNGPGDDMHFEINIGAAGAAESLQSSDPSEESPESNDQSSGLYGAIFKGTDRSMGITESLNKPQKIFKINDESAEKLYSQYKEYIQSLLLHLKKQLKLTKPVKIHFLEDDKNSKKVLGKTGGYINQKDEIHLFTTGRHIKDIMRSLSHELVHHAQNIRGEFKNHEKTTEGYAQSNKHLRKMEEEAYLKGNILFRDWEDNYKYWRK